MSKKIKGHVAHKMIVKGRTYFYIVAPERESVEAYAEWDQYPIGYVLVESIHITPRMVGRHGYLQSVIKRLNEYLSGDHTVVCCQDDENEPPWSKKYDVLFDSKEEKKMRNKTKVNGHVIHKLPKCVGLYYTVEPEHSCIAVYILRFDPATGEYCYSEFEDITIRTAQLGRPGYLQEQIEWIARRHSDLTPIRNYLEREKMLNDDTFAGALSNIKEGLKALNDTVFEEESNMNHYVLICRIKSDNDRVIIADEYIQVIQDRNKFTLLFDKADISEEEFNRFVNYLLCHAHIGGRLENCYHNKSTEFGNYVVAVTVSDAAVYTLASARNSFLDILTEGIKQHWVYPHRPLSGLPSDPSSVEFYIQELGPNADPIYKKEWPSLLNGTLHFWAYVIQRSESRPYIHNLVDCDPTQALTVRDGRVRGLPFPTYPNIYGDIFRKEYSDKDELISDFRGLIDDRKIFANASKVYIEFQPDREKI